LALLPSKENFLFGASVLAILASDFFV